MPHKAAGWIQLEAMTGTGEPGRDTQRWQMGKHPSRGDIGPHRHA